MEQRTKRNYVSVRCAGLLLALGPCFVSCQHKHIDEVTLQVGPEQVIRFVPKSAFAHYFEIPGRPDVLRIYLASYDVGCQAYKPPQPGEVFIAVTIESLPDGTIEEGEYLWPGMPAMDDDQTKKENAPQASAMPFVRLSKESRALPAGGGMTLKKLEAEPFGLVEGEFSFRDASLGEAAKTALIGSFSLRLCQLNLDEARRSPSPEP